MMDEDRVYIVKGPGPANYFIVTENDPFSDRLGQAMSMWGARRQARRILHRGRTDPAREYRVVESVTIR